LLFGLVWPFILLIPQEKYLKTTVSGMTGNMPDYCFLLVGSNMGMEAILLIY
jgi:GTPase